MATISLTWKDLNIGEDGFNIYRSESPMDVNNMPSPIATVSENVGSYDDGGVVPETIYYYRIGVMRNGEELISEELMREAGNLGPGNKVLIAGDMETEGFFGEVDVSELFSGTELASAIGLSAGTAQHSDDPWLKFIIDGEIIYVAKKPYRSQISWNHINAVNAVYNDENAPIVEKDGYQFRVTLMTGASSDPYIGSSGFVNDPAYSQGSEWNRLMYRVHQDDPSGDPWVSYTNSDIIVGSNQDLRGSITQETSDEDNSLAVRRGNQSITSFNAGSKDYTGNDTSWRPVLRLIT